ncbi:hypothetical protein PQX77_017122 [Marasmius sp. AFHP31]|nr:hypothetical protein PQX77_017122 [Marasmius sp. AFHP31]
MTELHASLKVILRDSDEILSLIEAYHIPENPKTTDGSDESLSNHGPELEGAAGAARNKRILAVVVHRSDVNGTEEGSLFVLKAKHPSNGYPGELDIRHVFPICGDFTISMAQMKHQSTGSGLKLTINPGLDTNHTLSFFARDLQGLRTILAECKRLKEASEKFEDPISPTQTFSWLATYTSRSIHLPTLSTIPPDLRLESSPLHARLSPASAGAPGDDADDILYIREEWVRTRARNASRKRHARLKVRIGTFNVNGKMPSQDLTTWVRGATSSGGNRDAVLPPVKELSPLSLGEVNKDPLDKAGEKRPPSPSIRSTFTDYSATLNDASSERKSENIEPAVTIDPEHPDDPDILVFGFQELDLSTEALIYSTSTTREEAWCTAIFSALGDKAAHYEKLASKQLVGILIVIIVKSSLRSCFSNVITSSAGVGLMGIMGNKGGTAIRLTFTPPPSDRLQQKSSKDRDDSSSEDGPTAKDKSHSIDTSAIRKARYSSEYDDIKQPGPTTLTFVCSHLAAFDEMVDKRNSDYQDLAKRLAFLETPNVVGSTGTNTSGPGAASRAANASGGGGISTDSGRSNINGVPVRRATIQVEPLANAASEPSGPTTVTERYNMFESDVLFWMGGKRPNHLPDSDVRTILGAEHWDSKFNALLKHDQLKNAMRDNKAFDLFSERPIEHLPTYRFSSGIMTDNLGYDIKRKPAWTDRVLYAHSSLTSLVLHRSYAGHPEITMSDHKPVSADFTVNVDVYDKNELSTTAKHLFRQLHGIEENQSRGKTQLSQSAIDLGEIVYNKPVKRTVSIRNTGKVPSAFRFVPLDTGSEIHPDWLSISPLTGLILPSEELEIVLSVLVDDRSASKLNLGSRDLDCTLIMHTLLGKDHFITVSGKYQYTCFANKLSRLTRLPGPIRSLKGPEDLLNEERAINAPREIMRLVNWMMTGGHHAVEDIFVNYADQGMVEQIRECLDTGEEFPFSDEEKEKDVKSLVAFGETLTQLLGSLPEGIIPEVLHSQCGQATSRDQAFEILDALPPAAVNVWISVTAFLHFIVQSSAQPEVRAVKIAARFAPILFRAPEDRAPTISPLLTHRFLLHFIQ